MNGPHRQTWASAADTANLADGVPVNIKLLGRELCLIRCGQQVYALLDRCSHQDFPLSEGEVDDRAIECALHGSRFDLATGAALGPPAVDPVPVFPVRVHMGEVYVGLPGDSDRSEDPEAQPTEIGPTRRDRPNSRSQQ